MSWNPALIDGPLTIYAYGEPDADGARQVTGTVPGYHLNAAPWLVTEDMANYVQEPNAPSVVFAGGATAFLKFPNEAAARAVLGAYWNEGAA